MSPLARMTTPEAPSITSCIPESLRSTRTSRRPPRCGTGISAGRSTRTSQAPSAHAARSVPSAAVGGGVVVTGAAVQALGPHPAIEFDAGEKRAHDYVRHGTTNLFAALNVTTGEVFGECKPTRNGANFLAFLKKAVKPHSDAEIHVVLDNLSTHTTPDVMAWLERNPHVYFHFTPARVNRSSARPMSSLDRPADHCSAPARVRPAGRPHPPARRWSRGRGTRRSDRRRDRLPGFGELVPVHDTVFDDQHDPTGRGDVGDRVAVHQDQVGELADRQRAEIGARGPGSPRRRWWRRPGPASGSARARPSARALGRGRRGG